MRAITLAALLSVGIASAAFAAGSGINCNQIREAQAETALGLTPGTLADVFIGPNHTLIANNVGAIDQLIRQDNVIQGIAEQNGVQINNINQVLRAAKIIAPGSALAAASTGQAMQTLLGACGVGSQP